MSESTTQDQDVLRELVRQRYAAAATRRLQEYLMAESALPVLNASNTWCSSTDTACGCRSRTV
jgi:hypothetical protein